MKTLLILVSLFCMNAAFAEGTTPLMDGDLSLSQAHAEITSVKSICPAPAPGQMRCMAIGSTVTIKVTLNGCADHFGGYFSNIERVEGTTVIQFAALNIFNKTSMVSRCVQVPTHIVQLHVPSNGPIELAPMEYTGVNSDVE